MHFSLALHFLQFQSARLMDVADDKEYRDHGGQRQGAHGAGQLQRPLVVRRRR